MEKNNYVIVAILGEDALCIVKKIYRKDLMCYRVVKELKGYIDDVNDKDYKRFLGVCKKMQVLNHPNIVKYYDPIIQEGKVSIEMIDYIDGITLSEYIEKKKGFIPFEEVCKFIKDIGCALAYCHVDIYKERMNPEFDNLSFNGSEYIIDTSQEKALIEKYRIIHNDLHCGNIIRSSLDGRYVLDGLGGLISGYAPGFTSPEKWIEMDKPTDQRDATRIPPAADIYSFGIIIYQMLAGKTPFGGNSLAAAYAHLNNTPPSIEPLRRIAYENANPGKTYIKDYPDWLEAMVMKCLEKDPQYRYTDAKEFMNEFKAKSEKFPQ